MVPESLNINPTLAPILTRFCTITLNPTTHLGKEPGEAEVTEAGETETMGEAEMSTTTPTETRIGFLFFTTRETLEYRKPWRKPRHVVPP